MENTGKGSHPAEGNEAEDQRLNIAFEDTRAQAEELLPLGIENQGFFKKMSEAGKDLAHKSYEGLYRIPVVNRVVGKMEIAYNKFWIDRNEEKAVKFKNKMDGIDLQVEAFEQSKHSIQSAIENLRQQNLPGVASLELNIKIIDEKERALLNKKDKVQSKFEKRENKVKVYMNERDRVANKLIERYSEKLKPMEEELENLQGYKDDIELLVSETEIKHREKRAELDAIEKNKDEIERSLKAAGMSEREIRKVEGIKTLEDLLAEGRGNMRAEQERLSRRKEDLFKKIAKVDAKASPYRDKRDEFVRVKEGRPLQLGVPIRERVKEVKDIEETSAHPRTGTDEGIMPKEESSPEEKTQAPITQDEIEALMEGLQSEEGGEQRKMETTEDYLQDWKDYLYKNKLNSGRRIITDVNNFLENTKLQRDETIIPEDFEKALVEYYARENILNHDLRKHIDSFLKERRK